MQYAELTYALPVALAEAAATALVEAGASGVEERDASTIERPEPGEVLLVVWIEPPAVDAFIARVAAALPTAGDRARPLRHDRDDDEWKDAWKRYFHARPVGRFVIVPSWETYSPAPGEIVLDLDPGRAFGTGGHASTRLCLIALDQVEGEVTSILDVGCGSGVLAIAAARRWPQALGFGVDVDRDAIEVSVENAERNHVADRLEFSTMNADRTAPAQLVFANIQPEVLIPMAPVLMARRQGNGTLILAGIIDPAADSVKAAYAALGEPKVLREEGWTALVYG
ncbi:MAG: 50S ribosomal protein L11 methyltransferase [Polyangia bacterium]